MCLDVSEARVHVLLHLSLSKQEADVAKAFERVNWDRGGIKCSGEE